MTVTTDTQYSERLKDSKHPEGFYTGEYFIEKGEYVYLVENFQGLPFETTDEPPAEIIDLTSFTAVTINVEKKTVEVVENKKPVYSLATKGGRARTGTDNKGSIVHAVLGLPQNGFWCTPAVCGDKPAKKGFGWLELNSEYKNGVTCEKCLNKLEVV